MTTLTTSTSFEEMVASLGPEWVLAAGPRDTPGGQVARRHLVELSRCRGDIDEGLTFVVTRPGRTTYVYLADASRAYLVREQRWVKPGDEIVVGYADMKDVT